MFTATRDELYRYLSENKRTDEVIQTILRSYTGLFADYVYIDESVIATRARVTPHEVYETLVGLSRYRIVNYIPHKKTPLIIYTQTREEQRYLSIPRSAYEERKERFGCLLYTSQVFKTLLVYLGFLYPGPVRRGVRYLLQGYRLCRRERRVAGDLAGLRYQSDRDVYKRQPYHH